MTNKLDVREDGNIRLNPLLGWSTHIVGGTVAILRLGYATSAEELKTGRTPDLQLAVTAAQLRELAETLLQAEKALLEKSIDAPKN
ncbi:hypothetical protein C8J36_103544 [Rhizobium sp. PP-F2F-G48]|uniref:hypothetical protein n=1 Tax=Rhizobium sp. PP-F2F-G48 TaxID=2135651 RepID=UPI001043775D|nr:hypothetical protein [Rhizobium sp. PP-F2F-G48]TCM56174.1 hypothetical protein C8J36_103544 [Rhizobium sp. PP-F2F-G48]